MIKDEMTLDDFELLLSQEAPTVSDVSALPPKDDFIDVDLKQIANSVGA